MGDDPIEPFGKETARATAEVARFGTRLLDSLDSLANYGAEIAGDTPHNLVGVLGGDWLREARKRNFARMQAKTRRILEERGRQEPFEEISPSFAVPLIEAAVDESREEMAELWAKLLAAALDPSRKNRVRLSFIVTLKQMDPLDAKVLEDLYGFYPAGFGQGRTGRDVLSQKLGVSQDEVLVSFSNLEKLNCIGFGSDHISPIISPMGRLLVEALR